MRTHLDRICVALPAAAALCIAALNSGPARAFPPGPTPVMRLPAGTNPAARGFAPPQRFAAPPQRVIVIYRNGPPGSRGGGANAGTSGASAGNNSGGGGSSSGGGSGGSVCDVFKQALGDFAKSAIDGLLKLPSK
jgi:uncharacterized membrane protein YgcG